MATRKTQITPSTVYRYVKNEDRHDVIRAGAHTIRRQLKKIPGTADPSRQLSGRLFGARTGISNTVQGELCRRIAAAQSTVRHPDVDDELVAELKRQKYLYLESHFGERTLAPIREQFNDLIEDDTASVVRGRHDDLVTSRVIQHPTSRIAELEDLLDSTILGITERFFGAHFKPAEIRCMRNYHVPDDIVQESESFANYWHCDQHPVDAIKIFITLHDTDERHGPLHVLRGDESKRISKQRFLRHKHGVPGKYVEENADVDTFTGPAGSVGFAKTNELLHRAGVPDEGEHRDMIFIYGYATDQPLSESWFDDIDPTFTKDQTPAFGG
ncbi:hypothetical protein ACFR97_17590 [Haloplanus litoreus]|uniref:Phytanoyl-CoA dioxygenase (PhyH) n=1 Tax=Haloplanus litoreus TaxID=767515 RepID=A0ABD5ZYH4_9EURY